jgi:uncharacterized protein YdiU (UPF0061 family)
MPQPGFAQPGFVWRFDTSYRTLPAMFYRAQAPVPVREPQMVIFNRGLAQQMGLDPDALTEDQAAELFSGNVLPADATPLAQAYAGHQFGGFTMLGDGRAVLLGEHLMPSGQRIDVQFKGSGPTPFSRRGDGRAALGPMLREFIISEAMHFLGIPTTRSLAVTATGEGVMRETVLAGAVLTRVAASHLRVGTFEYAAAFEDGRGLPDLASYAIARHDPSAASAEVPALALLQGVIDRQCALIEQWMRVGFIHGVMNTDNMTLSGETIDYGPCAFMDAYDPATVFSSIDQFGRYAFAKQPMMAQWNLARFAESLLPLLADDRQRAIAQAQEAVVAFQATFQQRWLAMMGRKIGLQTIGDGDEALINDLLAWMQGQRADYTLTFRRLTDSLAAGSTDLPTDPAFQQWQARWLDRLGADSAQAHGMMAQENPVYIPRNHLVEAALEAATEQGDLAPLHALLAVLADPYTRRPGLEAYEQPAPAGGPAYRTFCGT